MPLQLPLPPYQRKHTFVAGSGNPSWPPKPRPGGGKPPGRAATATRGAGPVPARAGPLGGHLGHLTLLTFLALGGARPAGLVFTTPRRRAGKNIKHTRITFVFDAGDSVYEGSKRLIRLLVGSDLTEKPLQLSSHLTIESELHEAQLLKPHELYDAFEENRRRTCGRNNPPRNIGHSRNRHGGPEKQHGGPQGSVHSQVSRMRSR